MWLILEIWRYIISQQWEAAGSWNPFLENTNKKESVYLKWSIPWLLMTSGPFYKHGLTLIPAWISNHMLSKVWSEITYPFPSFSSSTIEVWEWISNFISHIIMDVIIYPCCDKVNVSKRGYRWHNKPGHQQPGHWPNYLSIIWSHHWKSYLYAFQVLTFIVKFFNLDLFILTWN